MQIFVYRQTFSINSEKFENYYYIFGLSPLKKGKKHAPFLRRFITPILFGRTQGLGISRCELLLILNLVPSKLTKSKCKIFSLAVKMTFEQKKSTALSPKYECIKNDRFSFCIYFFEIRSKVV